MENNYIPKLVVFILSTLSFNYAFAQANSWSQKATISNPRYYGITFTLNDKGYIGCGQTGSVVLKDLWQYDPISNTWTQKSDYPAGPRYGMIYFSLRDTGYAGCGYNGTTKFNSFYMYLPSSNTWQVTTSFPGNAHYDGCSFEIGDKGYSFGGSNGGSPYRKEMYEFNPDGKTWNQKSNIPSTGRTAPDAIVISNKAYIIGGLISNSPNTATNEVWEFDPATDGWVQKTAFPGGNRFGGASFSIYNEGYYGCGANSSLIPQNDFYQYDPSTDTWSAKANYGGPANRGAISFSIGGYGYIGAGLTSSSVTSQQFWKYAPTNVSVYEPIDNRKIMLFPNPVSQGQHLKVNVELNEEAKIQIYNVEGKIVLSGFMTSSLSLNTNELHLKRGVYYITITGNDFKKSSKFLVY